MRDDLGLPLVARLSTFPFAELRIEDGQLQLVEGCADVGRNVAGIHGHVGSHGNFIPLELKEPRHDPRVLQDTDYVRPQIGNQLAESTEAPNISAIAGRIDWIRIRVRITNGV